MILGTDRLLRPGGAAAVVLEGGTVLKQAPFFGGGVNFSLVRNIQAHEWGQILWHSNSSLGNLKSVIYPRSRGWEKGKNQLNIRRGFRSRGKGCLTWSCKSLKITEGVERFSMISRQGAPTISKGFPTNLEHYLRVGKML